jgi:hypothetical protein
MNSGVLVQLTHQREQVIFAGFGREAMQLALNTDSLTRLPLVPHVNVTGWILTHQYGGQAGHQAVVLDQACNLLTQFRLDFCGDRFSVENSSCHD